MVGQSATDRIEAVIGTFAERALRRPRLAWALIAEPVDPLVDVERLAYRRAYARDLAALLREGIASGELPEQDVDIVAAALVGGAADALVGPTSPVADDPPPPEQVVAAIKLFARRAVGAPPAGGAAPALDLTPRHCVGQSVGYDPVRHVHPHRRRHHRSVARLGAGTRRDRDRRRSSRSAPGR